MKIKSILLVSLAALIILSLAAWTGTAAESSSQVPRTVTVTGDAEMRVVPDEVILTLGVETHDKSMETAKRQNDQIVTRLIEVAETYGIEPQHIQTEFLHIEPRYRNGYYEERDFVGYFVQKTVVLTLRDLTQFEGLLSDALAAGVNHVHNIQFRTTELRAHRDEARALAIGAAKEKAEALAGELGQQVGEPTSIQEVQSGWWSGYSSWWSAGWSGSMTQNVIQETGTPVAMGEGSLAPGQINIRAQVQVTFELSH